MKANDSWAAIFIAFLHVAAATVDDIRWQSITYEPKLGAPLCLAAMQSKIVAVRCRSSEESQHWEWNETTSSIRNRNQECLVAAGSTLSALADCSDMGSQIWHRSLRNLLMLPGDNCLIASKLRTTYTPDVSSCESATVFTLLPWASCVHQKSCVACSTARENCVWCQTKQGSKCTHEGAQCDSIDRSCTKALSEWIAPTAVLLSVVACCIVLCWCCCKCKSSDILLCCCPSKRRIMYQPEERLAVGPTSSRIASGSGRHRQGELRQGQLELQQLRRQWHAQRAAREAAREAGTAVVVDENRLSNDQEMLTNHLEHEIQWAIEQDILREIAQRAAVQSENGNSLLREIQEQRRRHKTMQDLLLTCPVELVTDTTMSDSCCICLNDYQQGEELRLLPCQHRFHSQCIEDWFARAPLCPICKESLDGCEGDATGSEGQTNASII